MAIVHSDFAGFIVPAAYRLLSTRGIGVEDFVETAVESAVESAVGRRVAASMNFVGGLASKFYKAIVYYCF